MYVAGSPNSWTRNIEEATFWSDYDVVSAKCNNLSSTLGRANYSVISVPQGIIDKYPDTFAAYPDIPEPTDYSNYKWIKVKKFIFDLEKNYEENYKALEQHHIEETTFLIEEVRKLANQIKNTRSV